MNSNRPTFTAPFEKGNSPPNPSPSWSQLPASAPPSAAGRKRSRDEAAPNLGDDDLLDPAPQSKPQENEEEWEYGEGMVLIKPNVGYIMEADSQTGTWAEEKLEEKPKPAVSPEAPILRATKSQRLNSTVPSIAEEVLQNGELIASSPERSNGLVEPTIDDFTRHLGIGWSLISASEHIQAAARGWTKYIENHYPVTNAKIRLQSKGLASYLVEANEGYFLFGEDLKQGRLVSASLEKVWENLRGPLPIFDGEVTMDAGETPKANGGLQPMTTIDETHMESLNVITMNGQSKFNEVEMDLS
ncbi:hypothetical protein LARI1_G004685 [Lachnellula arida]|uniref:Uncharacterized protein n=1 Tax=Lachnellula arida TaxID=1316785 RepID=A0A8T9BF55_9HELO|nr:hypothetical protein LARI1_G004685 [Lachnellula arida]